MRSLKQLFLFLSIGLLFACGGKENNVKFEEMSESEKISYLKNPIMQIYSLNAQKLFLKKENLQRLIRILKGLY